MLLRIQSNRSYFRATCTYAMSKHSASMRINKNKYRAVLLGVYFNYVLHIILSLVFPFHNDKNVCFKKVKYYKEYRKKVKFCICKTYWISFFLTCKVQSKNANVYRKYSLSITNCSFTLNLYFKKDFLHFCETLSTVRLINFAIFGIIRFCCRIRLRSRIGITLFLYI